jgi:mRNA interferase MazF
MRAGEIALTPLSQADGQVKNRPVLLLCEMPPFGDWLVCGISTQLRQEVAGFDEAINLGDEDFPNSGLKMASLVRLGFLAALPKANLLGSIGCVSEERRKRLVQRLSDFLRRQAS